jgi:hypothetical protein
MWRCSWWRCAGAGCWLGGPGWTPTRSGWPRAPPRGPSSARLPTLSRSGFNKLYLLFIKEEVYERPRFGTLRRWVTTAAVVRLVREPGGGVTVLQPDGGETFDALARRIVHLRRSGKVVGLVVRP